MLPEIPGRLTGSFVRGVVAISALSGGGGGGGQVPSPANTKIASEWLEVCVCVCVCVQRGFVVCVCERGEG